MKVLQETGTPFTKAQLEAAFDKVVNQDELYEDWRAPIVMEVIDKDDVHVTVAAIHYFTGAPVEVKDLDWNDEFMISSPGYRLGPAGC